MMYHSADQYLYSRHNTPSEPTIVESVWPRVQIPLVSLQKYLLQKLDKFSDQYLIECESDTTYTYHQLSVDARRMANAWRSLGLKDGDVFGIVGPNCYEYIVLYLAGIIAGGIASGIRSADTFREVADKVIQRNIKYIAISSKNILIAKNLSEGISIAEKIILFNGGNKLNAKFELYSDLFDQFDPIKDDSISLPDDPKHTPCIITSTTGSILSPKAVQFSHYGVVHAVEITSQPSIFGYTQSDVVSAHAQFSHQLAIFQIFTAIACGSKIAILPQFEYDRFVRYVKHFSITASLMPPATVISLLKDGEDVNIGTLSKIICSGSVLPKGIGQQFVDRYDHVIDFRQAFFQTESLGPIAIMIRGSTDYECVGSPIPNTRIKIIEPSTGEALSAAHHGEICVWRQNALSLGYYNNRDATRKLIDIDGWLHTGDIGYFDEDHMLYVIDNSEKLIRCGGLLIVAAELEGLLLTHNAVREAAVIGLPDDAMGEVPTGFVILNPKYSGKISGYDIEQFVNEQLPKRRKLCGVHVVNSFPKTLFGKIIKRQLRDDLLFNINKRKF